MYVSKLTIQNYRNLSNFEIELKPFTSIIGENNTGKTNLLNALGLIFSNEIIFFKKRILDIADINYGAIYDFKTSITNEEIHTDNIIFPDVKIEVILEAFNETQETIVADWFINEDLTQAKITYLFTNRNPKKKIWIEEQREYIRQFQMQAEESADDYLNRKIDAIDFPINDYAYSIYGGQDYTKQVDWYFLKMLRMEYLDALRDAKRELVASGDSRLLHKILANRDEGKFLDLKDALNFLRNAVKDNPELINIRDEIKGHLDAISLQDDSTDNSVDFQFSSIETVEILKKLSLVYGNEPVNIERNGMGRNNLLYISLILSHLSSKSSTADSIYYRLICIEEPEAHLHPHLQKHLGNSIQENANSENQIIITSHSTHVASKLDLFNTVVLYKDEENTVRSHYILSNFGTTADDKKVVRYLRKYLDATNSSIFFSRRVLLVEGISEQLVIPILFEIKCGNTIDKMKFNVVNVNGVGFRNFLEIAKNGYFIKFVVLTDSDTGTKVEDRADGLRYSYSEYDHILINSSDNSTFEKDIIAANLSNPSREILLTALETTRPISGKKYREQLGDSEIDVEEFFTHLEDYKSDFAFNLLELLNEKPIVPFSIPTYINQAFNFLMDE